ncbi:MAG: ATP-binding cassette domain-containing protein [Fibrobacterota bacterium]
MQIALQDKKDEIVFDHVTFGYSEERTILEDVSLRIRTGDTFVIVGQCGYGKSTMLKLCCGLLKPQKGTIMLRNRDTGRMLHDELMQMRLDMGYVFQNSALISNLPVSANIALPLRYHTHYTLEKINAIVKSRIQLLQLEGYENAMPASLSMGVMKRAAVARALALMPGLMFYDEPTSGLDPVNTSSINDIIRSFHTGFGITSVIVTHDMKSAFTIATTIAVVAEKRVIFSGTPEELKTTDNPYIKKFFDFS